MADRDRAAIGVDLGVIVRDAEVVEEGEHLDGERLVDLDQPDVVDGEPGAAARSVDGIGPTPMSAGSTPANA